MTRYSALYVLGLVLPLVGLSQRRRKDEAGSVSAFPRNQTVYVGGRQWGKPSSFNPLHSSPARPINGVNLIYETLLVYNSLSGKMEPLLAESYRVSENEIEVTLNPAARFSDGKPVTGYDVKYTFDLGQKHKAAPVAPIWGEAIGR